MCLLKSPGLALAVDTEQTHHRFSAYRLVTSVRHWAETTQLVQSREQEQIKRCLTLCVFLDSDMKHNTYNRRDGKYGQSKCMYHGIYIAHFNTSQFEVLYQKNQINIKSISI